MTEIQKRIQKLIELKADTVPQGFKTTKEWAIELGVEIARASEQLAELEKAKLAKRKKFRVLAGKTLRPVTHWALT